MVTYHRGHRIDWTDAKHLPTGATLYCVTGRFCKTSTVRPFLTSARSAKEWIDSEFLAADLSFLQPTSNEEES